MEPITTMAYAMTIVAGLATSIEHKPLSECLIEAKADSTVLCVEIKPPCGGVGEPSCEEAVNSKPTYRKKYYTKNGRRYYRLVKQ